MASTMRDSTPRRVLEPFPLPNCMSDAVEMMTLPPKLAHGRIEGKAGARRILLEDHGQRAVTALGASASARPRRPAGAGLFARVGVIDDGAQSSAEL